MCSFSLHFFSEDSLEGEGDELVTSSLVELVLELDPMKSECVQEAFKSIHTHEHTESESEESKEASPESNTTSANAIDLEGDCHDVFKEHTGQLRVSQ